MRMLDMGLLILLAMAAAGCAAEPERDAQGRHVVRLTADNRFVPDQLTVRVGETVVWVNTGGVHDVTADGGRWGSDFEAERGGLDRKMQPGDTFAHTFTEPVEEQGVFCYLHHAQGMAMLVTVK